MKDDDKYPRKGFQDKFVAFQSKIGGFLRRSFVTQDRTGGEKVHLQLIWQYVQHSRYGVISKVFSNKKNK